MTTPAAVAGEDSTPGLQLHLVDSDDEPLEEGAGGPRRPSTASLSRFRSCPQLSSADTHTQDSPESDDHGLGPELTVSNAHFIQGSPRTQPRHPTDEEATPRAHSPSPPSSAGSRTSPKGSKQPAPTVVRGVKDTVVPTPKALGRTRMEHFQLGRTASTDSPHTEAALRFLEDSKPRTEDIGSEKGSRPMSQFFEEPPELSLDGRLTMTEDGTSSQLGGGERSYHPDQDSIDKCARWLQSLKLTTRDRLKSRSHIQLPPL